MRQVVVCLLAAGLAGASFNSGLAGDLPQLGNSPEQVKTDGHVRTNPGLPEGREGGETLTTAIPIPALPFTDSGNTCDNINDYDEACPYQGSTSPDVVYSFVPTYDTITDVDLCTSTYDTKVYVYRGWSNDLIACNDDYYFGPPCGVYTSRLQNVQMFAGETYYIVVDGYAGDCGNYVIDVFPCAPGMIDCTNTLPEGEPPLVNGYEDQWNSGCSGQPPAWQVIDWIDTGSGCGRLCGVSGWYSNQGNRRDTDWFPVRAAGGTMTVSLTAPFNCNLLVLADAYTTNCAGGPVILYSATTGPCFSPATITWPTTPGAWYIVWVGPTEFSGPASPFEFEYELEVCGLQYSVIPAAQNSWGGVKDLFR